MIVPVLETPYIPIQDFREDWVNYSATWIEWSMTLAGAAIFILLFVFVSKLAPIIPVSEMLEEKETLKLDTFFRKSKNYASSKKALES
jgi:Ni/Fe-hydrogenase subunit HybB-like protein